MYVDVQVGGWFFRGRACKYTDEALAWCAKTPALGNGPLDVECDDKRDVHFRFAPTIEEAIRMLKGVVLQ